MKGDIKMDNLEQYISSRITKMELQELRSLRT